MSDQGDLLAGLPLPTRGRRTRQRVPCGAEGCGRPVYVDQLVYGLGRCCAERAGLLVVRYRFPHQHQVGETLLDHLPKESAVEKFPQARLDVSGMTPDDAHRKIVDHTRSMVTTGASIASGFLPAEIIEAANAQWSGLADLLERHAPGLQTAYRLCGDAPHTEALEGWPCQDYRDATRGIATGLDALAGGQQ